MMSTDNEIGINGYKKWLDYLEPIEKDANDEVEIELFSKYIKIPSETIILEL